MINNADDVFGVAVPVHNRCGLEEHFDEPVDDVGGRAILQEGSVFAERYDRACNRYCSKMGFMKAADEGNWRRQHSCPSQM